MELRTVQAAAVAAPLLLLVMAQAVEAGLDMY
jgi:hypothetical protein